MTHKLLTAVCALALVLSFSFNASAAVQNVKVGGDIEIKGIYQSGYDILKEVTGAGVGTVLTPVGFQIVPASGTYENAPMVHDYLMTTTRLYVDASLTDNVSAYVRLLNERDWDTAVNFLGLGVPLGTGSGVVEVDLAYLTLAEMYGYPFSLTIGRQELLYGEGFLVGDGVRAGVDTYQYSVRKGFDAIKAVWDYEPHQFDLFIAKITEGSSIDPVLGGIPRDTDNDLYGINWNYDGGMYGLWDIGLFYNRSNDVTSDKETQTWALSLRGEGSLPQIDVGTLALKGELVKEWGTVEPAMQPLGLSVNNERLNAWAGYVEGEYTFDNVYAPYFGLGYIYMSGDDADNSAIQQFNPLFEDETYGEIAETVYGMYYMTGDTTMTNASIWKLSAGVKPTENTALDFTYYSITAVQPRFSPFTTDLDDQNLFVGTEYDLSFTYNYSEDVTFGLMYNLFNPGKFFKSGADESAAVDVTLSSASQLMGSVKVTF